MSHDNHCNTFNIFRNIYFRMEFCSSSMIYFLLYIFFHFQTSWINASKKQREKLLELIRRLAEDDKEGVMAFKVSRNFLSN